MERRIEIRCLEFSHAERRRPRNRRTGSNRSPLHVAIIMDGNGRWAAARGLPRAEGHRRGVEALRRVVRAAHELGMLYLTIFSFSSENWSRPATEIGDLFGLLRRFIRNDLATLHRDGVRVRVIGEREGLEPDICSLLNEAEELTRNNTSSISSSHSTTDRGRRSPTRRSGWRAKWPRASAIPHRSTPIRSAAISMRPTFPIPT